MGRITDFLTRELAVLLSDLGKDGGRVGPAIYDTAMVLRLAPPPEGIDRGLSWLTEQQQEDGGWGSSAFPVTRELPTLASVLALRSLGRDAACRAAAEAGARFLLDAGREGQAVLDNLPIGLELALPSLVREAHELGIHLPAERYLALDEVGERRRRALSRHRILSGSPHLYSWEAWGSESTDDIRDRSGGVGSSPAATAAWVRAASLRGEIGPGIAEARHYLSRASAATELGIPGVVPDVWPVNRFEEIWPSFAVVTSGLSDMPELAHGLARCVASLSAGIGDGGIGHNDVFIPDGDDTACAVAVLKIAGKQTDVSLVKRFQRDAHFYTFPEERNPSLSTTAHAIFCLAQFEEDASAGRELLETRQAADGTWTGDKWHASWLYITHRSVLALSRYGARSKLERAADGLIHHQRPDGGWGAASSTSVETAHGVLTLLALLKQGIGGEQLDVSVRRGLRFLQRNHRPFVMGEEPLWIGKELYSMPRVDRVFELCAMLAASRRYED